MLRFPRRVRRAFTLVELLVVLGIIAVLISVLMPALARARSSARSVSCQSNIRQITSAALMYAQDHKVYVGFATGIDRKMLLYPYLKQGKDNADLKGSQVWHCPANELDDRQCGYGFNTNLNWQKLTKIRRWTETVALCDSGVRDGAVVTLSTMCQPPSKTSTGGNPAYRPNPRHPGQMVNVGFVDAHVEAMPMKAPFYPGPVGSWTGNNVLDPRDPNYKDQMWDLQ